MLFYISGEYIKGILKSLNEEQQKVFMELLPLSITLNITIPVILDEIYWKRKCVAASWNYLHYWINNCSWRESFVCHFVEEAIDNFLAKKSPFKQITSDLEVFVDHLKRVKINGYKGNFAEQKKKLDSTLNKIPFEETVGWLFTFFPNLEEVYLNIAPAEYVVSSDDDRDVKENNLFNAIFFLKMLVKLTIIGYSLKGKHVSMLADYLIGSKVVYLNLSCNLLNDDCCFNLGSVLNSQHLTTLILSNNCIGSTGITLLLSSLRGSNYLQFLDLSKNYINDDGGAALAEFLKADSVLRKLDISFNKLGCKSGKAFNDVLQLNSHLLCLNLSGNTL